MTDLRTAQPSVGIDGFNLSMSQGTGIARYGRNLLISMRDLGIRSHVLFGPNASRSGDALLEEIALTEPSAARSLSLRDRAGREARTLSRMAVGAAAHPIAESGEVIWQGGAAGRPPADRLWSAARLFGDANRVHSRHDTFMSVRFDRQPGPSAMHWTTALPVRAKKIPNLYTIHDLIPLKLPHSVGTDKVKFWKICKEIAKKADQIVTVSETSRQDIIRILGVEEDRVTNTYQAVDVPDTIAKRDHDNIATDLDSNFDLEWRGYFLHFGAVEPKKNLRRIVEAYLASGVRTPLVIVGGRGWMADDELAQLRQLERTGVAAGSRIRMYEYMTYPMLLTLISGARTVLFPSLYEGFGLPVLEAMALGAPVLTSTGGALPEVAGDAAWIVDPYDVSALADGIRTLDADFDLRNSLAQRGLIRAACFSPDAYRARLTDLYAKVGVTA